MVEPDHIPISRCGMTEITGFSCGDMGRMFSWRLNTVMASCTGARYHLTVIETDRLP